LFVFATTGCDTEEGYLDHNPPDGQGSLIIDNHTGDDIAVFVDGSQTATVNDSSDRILDMVPGAYRLVLVEKDDGDRSYSSDVDVLEGRLTILDVWSSGDPDEYSVETSFE
jgi:hypothetical protein